MRSRRYSSSTSRMNSFDSAKKPIPFAALSGKAVAYHSRSGMASVRRPHPAGHRHPDQPGMEPQKEGEPHGRPDRDRDQVVLRPGRERYRAAMVADLVAALCRDSRHDGPGEDRAEEEDRAEIAVGEKVCEGPELHPGEHRVLEGALDPAGKIGCNEHHEGGP